MTAEDNATLCFARSLTNAVCIVRSLFGSEGVECFVVENKLNVGLDAAILMNPQTWVASGHLAGFSDPLMDCKECHERFRADKLIEDWANETGYTLEKPIDLGVRWRLSY